MRTREGSGRDRDGVVRSGVTRTILMRETEKKRRKRMMRVFRYTVHLTPRVLVERAHTNKCMRG